MSAGDLFSGKIVGLLYSLHIWGLTHNDPVVSSLFMRTFAEIKPAVDDFTKAYQIVGRKRLTDLQPVLRNKYSLSYVNDLSAEITRQVGILMKEETALVHPLLVINTKINTLAYEIQRTW